MRHTKILQLLQAYIPTYEEEKAKRDIITFIRENEDCFERENTRGHLTASAFLLNKNNDKALLMHHRKLNDWYQLGGHCNGESDLVMVALKEAQEESGIAGIKLVLPAVFDVDVHDIPENAKEKSHIHYDVRFLCQVVSDEDICKNEESHALAWFSDDEKTWPTHKRSVTRLFEKWSAIKKEQENGR